MTRKASQTQTLAEWFVKNHLKREFDYRFDRQHLKSAKELVNPDGEVKPLDMEVVQICIDLLSLGFWGFSPERLTSLHAVTWGTPPYYERALDIIKNVPNVYEVCEYDGWCRKYGKIARRMGFWDGAYQGYANPLEREFRMPMAELGLILAAGTD